jgi:hypothetical protein
MHLRHPDLGYGLGRQAHPDVVGGENGVISQNGLIPG